MPAESVVTGLIAYSHHCPALGVDVRIEISDARVGFSEVRFCCYCGLRVDRARLGSAGQDWELETTRHLARRWLGSDAALIQEWIGPEGDASMRFARSRGPLLEFLLSKLRNIAQRRRNRISRTLSTANRDFAAIWRAEQILDAARAPDRSRTYEIRIGIVYAISNGSHLKIGWSARHPELSRLSDLQVASADQLEVVGAFVGSQQDEHSTHQRFYSQHIRGEWFYDVPEIRAFFRKRSASDKNTNDST
jgi:hypothetical protein